MGGKLAALLAGLVMTLLAPSQPGFSASRPHLVADGGHDLFAGASALAPGGAALISDAIVTFTGQRASRAAGLYFSSFASRGRASQPTCTAADPAAKFDFTVSEDDALLYQGTLADFAAAHRDPASRLPLAGRGGVFDRWAPGDTMTVSLAVALDRSADNSLMGCTTDTRFAWFAE